MDNLKGKYKTVCEAPSGNGFRVEHMPEFLLSSDIDDCSAHVHSFYEILWFQEGTGMHIVDFQEYEVKPHTIFFLSPGQIHYFDRKTGYKGVAIKMCTDFMRDEEVQNNLFLKYNVFHSFDKAPCYTINPEMASVLQELVNDMETEANCEGEFGHIDVLKSLLRIFLVKIERYGMQKSELQLDHLRPSLQLFIQFRSLVEKEFRRLHTVQEYAEALNVAVRTLNKCVNECSGKSPLTFINDRVMLEAKRLVRYTNMVMKNIAFELGFEDQSYFVKQFKRQTGYLPSEFRKLDQVSHSIQS